MVQSKTNHQRRTALLNSQRLTHIKYNLLHRPGCKRFSIENRLQSSFSDPEYHP